MLVKALTLKANSIPKDIHRKCGQNQRLLWPLLITTLVVAGCSSQAPRNPHNLCDIFEEKRGWYHAAKRTQKKWGVPLQIPMAMMYQESSFRAKARPPKKYLLGFIPWGRVSSAYGYSQAKTGTWNDYTRETDNGWAERDDFSDAIDFMGWYIHKTHKINRVSKWDAHHQYLNYHEGWGGYRHGSYKQKQWLIRTSDKVLSRASNYGAQYRQCKDQLDAGWLRRLFM